MHISDQELRQLVRDAIARHATSQPAGAPRAESNAPAAMPIAFGRFVALTPAEDGQCVIEPAVRCNHCGYCQSYGH